MTYIEKKNIVEAICQNLRNKYVYETDMQKIYNLIVGQKNEQLQEKAGIGHNIPGGKDRLIPY